MTDAIEKLAEVIGKNISQSPRGIGYAVLAALPELVKPLQWEDHPESDGPVLSQAFVQGGGYFICDDTDDFTGKYLDFVSCDKVRWWQHVRSTSIELRGNFHDDDLAPLKAAADAHHIAQIMQAFGVDALIAMEGAEDDT